MAIAPQNSDVFLREVDEELRRERLEQFGRRYGLWLIAAVLLGLAAFGGWLYWQHHREGRAEAASEALSLVLRDLGDGKTDEAAKKLETLAHSSNAGVRASALLAQAAVLAEKVDSAGMRAGAADEKARKAAEAEAAKARADAVAAYRKIADDANIAQPFRELALIRQTALEFDTLTPEAVVARLKPLAVDGGPWFGSAGEMVAIAYLRMKKPELAAPIFGKIAEDEGLPETIRSRAREMAGVLGVDAVDQTNESAPDED